MGKQAMHCKIGGPDRGFDYLCCADQIVPCIGVNTQLSNRRAITCA